MLSIIYSNIIYLFKSVCMNNPSPWPTLKFCFSHQGCISISLLFPFEFSKCNVIFSKNHLVLHKNGLLVQFAYLEDDIYILFIFLYIQIILYQDYQSNVHNSIN